VGLGSGVVVGSCVVPSCDGRVVWTPVGEGEFDNLGQIRALLKDGFQGTFTLEKHWHDLKHKGDPQQRWYSKDASLAGMLKVIERFQTEEAISPNRVARAFWILWLEEVLRGSVRGDWLAANVAERRRSGASQYEPYRGVRRPLRRPADGHIRD
jgi:hypothetical protein